MDIFRILSEDRIIFSPDREPTRKCRFGPVRSRQETFWNSWGYWWPHHCPVISLFLVSRKFGQEGNDWWWSGFSFRLTVICRYRLRRPWDPPSVSLLRRMESCVSLVSSWGTSALRGVQTTPSIWMAGNTMTDRRDVKNQNPSEEVVKW